MKLARKQGMNTDVRRRVFVVVMSSTVSSRAGLGRGWEAKSREGEANELTRLAFPFLFRRTTSTLTIDLCSSALRTLNNERSLVFFFTAVETFVALSCLFPRSNFAHDSCLSLFLVNRKSSTTPSTLSSSRNSSPSTPTSLPSSTASGISFEISERETSEERRS